MTFFFVVVYNLLSLYGAIGVLIILVSKSGQYPKKLNEK